MPMPGVGCKSGLSRKVYVQMAQRVCLNSMGIHCGWEGDRVDVLRMMMMMMVMVMVMMGMMMTLKRDLNAVGSKNMTKHWTLCSE